MTPARAMRAAESLYLDGLISYPRTDNTVYPPSLDLRGSLQALAQLDAGRGHGGAAGRPGEAHAHARQEAHHRPPADLPGGRAARRRSRATRPRSTTSSSGASWPRCCRRRSSRASASTSASASEPFLAHGSRVASLGYLEVYEKYAAKRDRPLPPLEPGDELHVLDLHSEAKETQPPGRYGQGRLIEKMEELGLGTKATRADIIQHLYDRNYVRDNPVEPTELGVALIAAFDAAMEQGAGGHLVAAR